MRKLRAALVGCGRIGSDFADDADRIGVYSHAGAYDVCRETTLVAVCDQDLARAEACARRWNVARVFTDHTAMLEELKPDLVSICTPDDTHEQILHCVLRAGSTRGVLMEKPLALTDQEASRLVRDARNSGVVLSVNYSRRYAPSHQRVRRLLQTGRIGRVQSVFGVYGKGTLHNGTHWLDLARAFFGEVKTVRGFDTLGEVGSDPTLSAWIEFGSGVPAVLQGCDASAFSIFEMDIIGTAGRVRMTESGHAFEFSTVGPSPKYAGYRVLRPARGPAGGLRDVTLHALRDLVRCVRSGGTPLCSGADALAAVRLALAIQRSAKRKGRPVTPAVG